VIFCLLTFAIKRLLSKTEQNKRYEEISMIIIFKIVVCIIIYIIIGYSIEKFLELEKDSKKFFKAVITWPVRIFQAFIILVGFSLIGFAMARIWLHRFEERQKEKIVALN